MSGCSSLLKKPALKPGHWRRKPATKRPRLSGSTTTVTQGEEKDPFLSLLEQLAENEQANGQAGELDLFLAGAPNSG